MSGQTLGRVARAVLAGAMQRTISRIATLTLLLFVSTPRMDAQAPAMQGVGIDHLILGVDDLDRGMSEFARRTGVTPIKGGVHPGKGTQNALVSLGDMRYIEILAPSREPGIAPDQRTAFPTLTPVGWALHTRELAPVVAVLRRAGFTPSEIRPGARARPDGVRLTWQTAEVSGAGLEAAPFFIAWGATTPHPSTQSPAGCTLRSVSMTEPDPAPLTRFLTTVGVTAPVRGGAVRAMSVVLACPSGEVRF